MIRVMIVEDEPHAQRRLQRMIERLDDFFRVEPRLWTARRRSSA